VDYEKAIAWHTDPVWGLELAMEFTSRVFLDHHYLPFEFAITMFNDTELESGRSTYRRRLEL